MFKPADIKLQFLPFIKKGSGDKKYGKNNNNEGRRVIR